MATSKSFILISLLSLSVFASLGQSIPHTTEPRDTILPKVDTLRSVIIKAAIIPKFKGDTLEYHTSNIHLKPNSLVEDLLGRLPGLRINANGDIIYNGEKISRVLIDGEDLFASDPTLITRNFVADIIDRIQVIDKKTDVAQFSGIDDGKRIKTLNLVLKPAARNKAFTKVEASTDGQGVYDVNGLMASFRGREQITALGLAANTGELGFGGDPGHSQPGLTVLTTVNDPLGASAGLGIPKVISGGLHYANAWNNKQDHLFFNYQYGQLSTQPTSSSTTQQILPNYNLVQDQISGSLNSQYEHQLHGTYDYNPDTLISLRLNFEAMTAHGQNQFNSTTVSTIADTPINNSLTSIQSTIANQDAGAGLLLNIRVPKHAGQSFFIGTSFQQTNNSAKGYLYSINRFLQPQSPLPNSDTTNQLKIYGTQIQSDGVTIGYTRSLGKQNVFAIEYDASIKDDHTIVSTYNHALDKYQEFVDTLSEHIKSTTINQKFMLNLQGKKGPLSYTFSGSLIGYSYRQHDLLTNSTVKITQFSVIPLVNINYTVNRFSNLLFTYDSHVDPPSDAQLQPNKNNNNSLNIVVGNPALHSSTAHNFEMDLQNIRPFLMQLRMSYAITDNAIVTKTYTNSLGRQTTQYINANGTKTIAFGFLAEPKLMPWDVRLQLFTNLSYSRSINFVNALLNKNDMYSTGGGINLSKYLSDKYSVRFSSELSHFYNTSSLNSIASIQYWTQNHILEFRTTSIKDIEISSDANYAWQEKTSVFSKNISTLFWNSSISRDFLKNKLTMKWSIVNILDQHTGISRNSQNNTNSQTITNIRGRYWLISAVYRFEKQHKIN